MSNNIRPHNYELLYITSKDLKVWDLCLAFISFELYGKVRYLLRLGLKIAKVLPNWNNCKEYQMSSTSVLCSVWLAKLATLKVRLFAVHGVSSWTVPIYEFWKSYQRFSTGWFKTWFLRHWSYETVHACVFSIADIRLDDCYFFTN